MGLIVITMKDLANIKKTGRPLSFDRDAALQQAMLAFWRHGYETTSISELTEVMGITAPSLYAAFGDKQRLFLEAMRLYAGSPYELDAALAEAPTARAAAQRMLHAAAKAFTTEAMPKGCLLASATASGSSASADVQAEVANIRRDIQQRLQNRIEQDITQGALPTGTNSTALAALVIALIQGMSVLARDGTDRQSLLQMIDVALTAWPLT